MSGRQSRAEAYSSRKERSPPKAPPPEALPRQVTLSHYCQTRLPPVAKPLSDGSFSVVVPRMATPQTPYLDTWSFAIRLSKAVQKSPRAGRPPVTDFSGFGPDLLRAARSTLAALSAPKSQTKGPTLVVLPPWAVSAFAYSRPSGRHLGHHGRAELHTSIRRWRRAIRLDGHRRLFLTRKS